MPGCQKITINSHTRVGRPDRHCCERKPKPLHLLKGAPLCGWWQRKSDEDDEGTMKGVVELMRFEMGTPATLGTQQFEPSNVKTIPPFVVPTIPPFVVPTIPPFVVPTIPPSFVVLDQASWKQHCTIAFCVSLQHSFFCISSFFS